MPNGYESVLDKQQPAVSEVHRIGAGNKAVTEAMPAIMDEILEAQRAAIPMSFAEMGRKLDDAYVGLRKATAYAGSTLNPLMVRVAIEGANFENGGQYLANELTSILHEGMHGFVNQALANMDARAEHTRQELASAFAPATGVPVEASEAGEQAVAPIQRPRRTNSRP